MRTSRSPSGPVTTATGAVTVEVVGLPSFVVTWTWVMCSVSFGFHWALLVWATRNGSGEEHYAHFAFVIDIVREEGVVWSSGLTMGVLH